MTLQIPLSAESEARLRARAAAVGKDPVTLVREMLEVELSTEESSGKSLSFDQRIAELREWAASHRPLPYEADDSRESIYEGRGE